MEKKQCEFCFRAIHGSADPDDTVCGVCDRAMIRAQKKEDRLLEARASKRKCQSCKEPLKPGRWFNCALCAVAIQEDPSEDYYEVIGF